MMDKKPKKKKTWVDYLLTIILVMALGVFCYAGYHLITIYLEYREGTEEYNNLTDIAVTLRDDKADTEMAGISEDKNKKENKKENKEILDVIKEAVLLEQQLREENLNECQNELQTESEAICEMKKIDESNNENNNESIDEFEKKSEKEVIEKEVAENEVVEKVVSENAKNSLVAGEFLRKITDSLKSAGNNVFDNMKDIVLEMKNLAIIKSDIPEVPIEVDFQTLTEINDDVIGWIYMEAIDSINYPIVQGVNNETYLHHTYEGNYNFAGTIFIDYENSRDFSDCNTFVYGHNMKNGSMFAQLKKYVNTKDTFEKSRYFWILTPDADYRYEIIAAYTTGVKSETYILFKQPGEKFFEYINNIREWSAIETTSRTLTTQAKVVTLSTCTGNDATRFVVQGVRVNRIPKLQR